MKKYLIIWLSLLLPLAAAAQSMDFHALYKKYTGRAECTTMEFTGALLQMMAGGDEDGFLGVKYFKMLTTDDADAELQRDVNSLQTVGYTVLVNINEGGSGVKILHRENFGTRSEKVKEYLLLAIEGKSVTAIYIEGDIKMENLAKLSELGKNRE